MKVFKSAALMLVTASAAMAFAPASVKTSAPAGVSLSMSATEDSCDDRRSFVSKVSS